MNDEVVNTRKQTNKQTNKQINKHKHRTKKKWPEIHVGEGKEILAPP